MVGGIILGVMCAAAMMLVLFEQQVINVCRAILLKFAKQQVIDVRRSTGAKLQEHRLYMNVKKMLKSHQKVLVVVQACNENNVFASKSVSYCTYV